MKVLVSSFIFFIFFSTTIGTAQLSDIARIDYTNIPKVNSGIGYNRIRVLFNYPIKLKKEGTYLFLGLDYSNIDLEIDERFSFDRDRLDGFQLLDFNLGYTTPLKNDWRLGIRVTPGLSSNLSASDLFVNDIVFSSDVVFIKDKTKDTATTSKPWRLILGVSYSGNRGFVIPLPFISYYRKIHPKWSYNLGVPKTNLQYHINKIHRLKAYVELDGFTSNLQSGLFLDNGQVAESVNMSLVLGGIRYEYHITKHIQLYLRTAYILSNSVQLRDDDKDNILGLDDSNNLYLRTGIRFKI